MESVYLVGFMGSGKSTVGRLVAERLGMEFVDLDDAVEKRAGRSVPEIFGNSGEEAFRKLESEVLAQVSSGTSLVVALGGGTYAARENRALIEMSGIAVYLETELATVLERIRIDGTRPLFSDTGQVRALYDARLPSYTMAPVRVRTDDLGPDEVADRIVQTLQAT